MIQNVAISFGWTGFGMGKSKQCHENENKIQKSSKIRICVVNWVGVSSGCTGIDISIFAFGPAGFGFGNDQSEAARISFFFLRTPDHTRPEK